MSELCSIPPGAWDGPGLTEPQLSHSNPGILGKQNLPLAPDSTPSPPLYVGFCLGPQRHPTLSLANRSGQFFVYVSMTSYCIQDSLSAPPSKNCGVLAPLLSAVLFLMHAGFPLLWPQIQSWTPTAIRCAWNSHPPGSCDRHRRTLGLQIPQLPGVSLGKPAKPRAPAPCPDTPRSRSSHPAPECALFLPRLLGQGPTSHPVFGDRHVGVVPEPSAHSPPLGLRRRPPATRPPSGSLPTQVNNCGLLPGLPASGLCPDHPSNVQITPVA